MTTSEVSRTEQSAPLIFTAPDGGSWMLDTTHHGRRPVSGFVQPIYTELFPKALGAMAERFGLPLAEFRAVMINGCFYLRPMGIGEPENPKGDPPLALMKVITRVHPKLRQRNKIAKKAWEEKLWREDVDNWFGGGRDQVVVRNLALQATEPSSMTDPELSEHLGYATAHMREQAFQSGATHGGDIIPIGDFMAHCVAWGIPQDRAASLLAGASPASVETAIMLMPVGQALQGAESAMRSVDDIRELGPDVSAAIDNWLRHHGQRVVTSDDIDGETLMERPDLQLKALLATPADPQRSHEPSADEVRSMVPGDQRLLFDELLGEARYGLRLRDDNVGVRWNWPTGLVRRALIEAGHRLVAADKLDAAEQVIEMNLAEVQLALGGTGPSKEQISDRWAFRQLVIASEPPDTLGPVGAGPPVSAFPKPLARATAAMMAMISAMEGEHGAPALTGVGVGTEPYRGRAVVVKDAIEALEQVQEGDVVVAPFTGPAWNSILPAIGALVVEEGGPMSHGAIVAREFGIPAIVGAAKVTQLVHTGDDVTIDPVTGTITIHS